MSRAKISQAPPHIFGEALEEATRSTTQLTAHTHNFTRCASQWGVPCVQRALFFYSMLCLSKVYVSGNNVKEVNISQLARLTHKKQKEAKLCIHEPNPSLFLFLNNTN